MHFFGLFLFLAAGITGLSMVGERFYRRMREGRPIMNVAWGIGLAWLANLSMWSSWSIGGLRYGWVGVTLTGLALGGVALLFHSIVAFFIGIYRKSDEEAEQIERTELRKVG